MLYTHISTSSSTDSSKSIENNNSSRLPIENNNPNGFSNVTHRVNGRNRSSDSQSRSSMDSLDSVDSVSSVRSGASAGSGPTVPALTQKVGLSHKILNTTQPELDNCLIYT